MARIPSVANAVGTTGELILSATLDMARIPSVANAPLSTKKLNKQRQDRRYREKRAGTESADTRESRLQRQAAKMRELRWKRSVGSWRYSFAVNSTYRPLFDNVSAKIATYGHRTWATELRTTKQAVQLVVCLGLRRQVDAFIRSHNRAHGTTHDPDDTYAFLQYHDILVRCRRAFFLHCSEHKKVEVLAGMRLAKISMRSRLLQANPPDSNPDNSWLADPSLENFPIALMADNWMPSSDLPTVPLGAVGCRAPINGVASVLARDPFRHE